MAKYCLIESRDPFESNDVGYYYDLAAGLVHEGHEVTLFLVENGVLAARQSIKSDALTAISEAGVEVLADAFSLRERAISDGQLATGVKPAPLETVVDHMADGRRTMWH